eukprot:g2828.t1
MLATCASCFLLPLALAVACLAPLAHGSTPEGEAFLAKNREAPGVVALPSGLQYKVLRRGTGGFHPTRDSPCECHYAGTLITGEKFDSSYDRGSPTTFAPSQVIKGWTEAMQLMVEGDKWQLFIPSQLAYGQNPRPGGIIKPGDVLVFEIEIIKIKGGKVPAARRSGDISPDINIAPASSKELADDGGSGTGTATGGFTALLTILLKLGATGAAFGLFLSPLSMCRAIRAKGTTGSYSAMPVMSMFLNCFAWCCYGVLKGDLFPVGLTNVFGVTLSAFYCSVFVRCAAPRSAGTIRQQGVGVLAGAGMLTVYSYLACGMADAAAKAAACGSALRTVGSLAVGLNIIMFAAPLATIRDVVQTQDSSSIPAGIVAASTVCSGLWMTYGVLVSDYFILVPNLLGFVLGLLQLGLIRLYKSPLSGGLPISQDF